MGTTPEKIDNAGSSLLPDYEKALKIAKENGLFELSETGWKQLEQSNPTLVRFLMECHAAGKITADQITGFALAVGMILASTPAKKN